MRRVRKSFNSMYKARNKFLLSQTTINNPKFGVLKAGPTNLKFGLSKAEDVWLDKLNIPMRSVPVYGLPLPNSKKRKVYIVDGYDPNTNTIYEYLGDRYHGSPKRYTNLDVLDKQLGKTYRQLYTETQYRFSVLYSLGYKVVFVWESDCKKGFAGRFYRGPSDNLL